MKKILLAFLISLPAILSAQSVPNGGFEDWDITNYDKLTGWQNSNTESLRRSGKISATKTTDSYSGSAILLETVAGNNEISGGYVVNAEGDPIRGEGGFPFAAIPANITGYYKYDLKGNDSALILVIFKKNGQVINTNVIKFRGTGSLSSYTPFSYPLTLNTMPDTVIVGAASSNLMSGVGIEVGSKLFLDNLAFTGSGTMPSLPNGDFENWTTASFDKIKGWNSFGEGITRTTDKYKGSYAISLQTIDFGNGNINSSGLTTGNLNGPFGGKPYSKQVDTLIGYYKYTATGGDSAIVFVNLTKNGMPVGGNSKILGPASTYTKFEIPFSAQSAPDTIKINIYSSLFSSPNNGSTLIVDEIQLKSEPLVTSIEEEKINFNANVFPNPASNKIRIIPGTEIKGYNTVNIYNSIGELVLSRNFNNLDPEKGVEIEIETLKTGMYFYQIVGNNSQLKSDGRFIKN